MVGDHMPHPCSQNHPHALPRFYYDRPSHSCPYSCLGRAWAQVGYVVTYHASPEGSLIYTVFTKKVSKTVKKRGGVPPIFDRKSQCSC